MLLYCLTQNQFLAIDVANCNLFSVVPIMFLYLNIHYNVYDVEQITFITHLLQNFYEALFIISHN